MSWSRLELCGKNVAPISGANRPYTAKSYLNSNKNKKKEVDIYVGGGADEEEEENSNTKRNDYPYD
jgi:hypothetical protein